MQQSKTQSIIESIINILIGFGVSLASQMMIFPAFNIHISLSENLGICAWFTAISLTRSYIIRRWFNARLHATAKVLASQVNTDYTEKPRQTGNARSSKQRGRIN